MYSYRSCLKNSKYFLYIFIKKIKILISCLNLILWPLRVEVVSLPFLFEIENKIREEKVKLKTKNTIEKAGSYDTKTYD